MRNKIRLALLLLTAALLSSACSKKAELAGHWRCTTTHPGGAISTDVFEFSAKGGMTLKSSGMLMHGTYSHKKQQLTIELQNVPVPGPQGSRTTQQQTLSGTLQKLTEKELEMDLSTGTDHHLSKCRPL